MTPPADICLLLEGTYPFVRGGVASWVHDLVQNLPERTFSLVFLGGNRAQAGRQAYELPKNVVSLHTHYLFDEAVPRPDRAQGKVNERAFADSARLHDLLRDKAAVPFGLVEQVAKDTGSPSGIPAKDFFRSERSWQEITARYERHCTDPSFTDYFWTVRTMHAPLFGLAALARELPEARVYHTISTGYAGYLGTLLRSLRGRPLVISEHGIYTKERRIDLAHASWIREPEGREGQGYLRELWARFFEGLGKMAYVAADPIVALYEGNRARQIADGADAARTRVIPNGIDVQRFAALRPLRDPKRPLTLGLLGRVTPIKDIRTFVRMMRAVCDAVPEAEGLIIGPTDEDPVYARECEELIAALGLRDRVRLLGFRRPEEVLPKLGLLVLTSISEALPLVLLESMASGLPVLTTDVGACREIVEGGSPEDRALGAAGAVVPIADPEAAARAALALLEDDGRWAAAQRAGIARVERFYTRERMLSSYRALYEEAARWPASASS